MAESAGIISSLTSGNADQIQEVINTGLVEPLIKYLSSGDSQNEDTLVQMEVLKPFCDMLALNNKNTNTVLLVMDGISNVLQTADKMGKLDRIKLMIEDCGGLLKLEHLQNHESDQIYQKALHMIDKYFSEEEADEFDF